MGGVQDSGITKDATPKKQRGQVVGAGSEVHVAAGKGAQHESTGAAQDPNTTGVKDSAVKTGKPSDSKSGAVADAKNPTAKPATPSSKANTSDTKTGGASEPKNPANKVDHASKKADHTGGQSTGNEGKSGAKHTKHRG